MAKLLQGILGGISGAIGNVVGSSWKGIPVIKTKPLSVANPQTAGQVAQRTKFTNVVAFAGLILATVIKPLWDRFASKQSGYNEFISTNIDLFAAVLPVPRADLVISKGKMASTAINAINALAAQKVVTVEWTDDSGTGFKLEDDLVYIVAVNITNGEVAVSSGVAERVEASAEATFLSNLSALDDVDVYMAFKRADGTVVSNTSYFTDTIPAP